MTGSLDLYSMSPHIWATYWMWACGLCFRWDRIMAARHYSIEDSSYKAAQLRASAANNLSCKRGVLSAGGGGIWVICRGINCSISRVQILVQGVPSNNPASQEWSVIAFGYVGQIFNHQITWEGIVHPFLLEARKVAGLDSAQCWIFPVLISFLTSE